MEDLVASTLSSTLKIPHAVARFLVSRGIKTVSDAYHMLCSNESDVHDPYLMMGMDKAVEWILAVRERGERVFIFGDYDLDGMTSVTLLTRCLKTVGIESEWRLPNRFGDGYGLSVSAVDEMYEAGARNLITVDTGITANVEIAHAKELGMAVMVMDHHQPSGDGLPVCDVLLDPHQEGDNYPNPELCGVGVSYKFICALFSRLGIKAPVEYLDLVALGTLADLVQMTPENRYFTRTGLESLKNSRWPGVQEMYTSLMKPHSCVGGIDVMYKLAPLLNAPGRMERPDPALKLLLCENKVEAGKLLEELKDWNTRRKQKEAEITEMAMEQVKALYGDTIPTVIVVAGENWHVGVIGIVAAKLAQEFHRPSAVLSIINGMAHASARAVPGFNWHKALFDSRELFDRWGGHANAAGFSLEAGKIEELRGRLLQSAADQGYTGEVINTDESYPYDIKIALRELTVETRVPTGRYPIRERSILEFIDLLEPFGGNFPYPAFRAENVTVHRVRELRGGHLQMEISQAGSAVFPAIAFGLRKSKALLGRSRPVTVVFEPIWNYYNNTKTVQLCIKSIE
ncbi:single-stranded-DNA-specific exonuclease RecJ [Fibrobacter sp. UBA4297]|uniref:single-stranded-DNA-specific exonuclease RecJ n=1 Tax=Fibrobacter sp. UBA4297 TaxID=1946536 RepID=UPI0025C1D0A9|nr:single-stranded-DNA-specific exonuclease RecJ [Fibrobacter sp. UBA4297]